MANECRGVYSSTLILLFRDGKTVDPPRKLDDGDIEINAHTGIEITGRRRKADDPLPDQQLKGGICQTVNGIVKISFLRFIPGEVIHYDGILFPNGEIKGSYFITSGPSDPGDQGTWVAQQGGNFDEGEDNDEQGERRGEGKDESNNPRQSK